MKRKVNQVGTGTLTVSLPNKWVKENNLKKGDEVDVEEKEKSITISTERRKELPQIDIDVTGLDRSSIMFYIRSCYRMGYDQINIKFDKPTTMHFRTGKILSVTSIIHKEVDHLIGVEIIDQKEDHVVIKDYSKSSIEDFDNSLRRIFLLTVDLSSNFKNAIYKPEKNFFNSVEERHDTITKFISYSLRLLNKSGYSEQEKTTILYHIIDCMDLIVDTFKYSSRDINNLKTLKFSKQTKEIVSDIDNSIRWYYELFYKYDNSKVVTLNKNRDDVKIKIKKVIEILPKDEIVLIVNLQNVLELIWDLMVARMSLRD